MRYKVCGNENHLLRNDKRRNVVIPVGARKHMKEMFRMKGILWVTDQKCQSVQWLSFRSWNRGWEMGCIWSSESWN